MTQHDQPFSAMICLYKNNIASEVKQALDSAILAQTCPPAELVVVHDGPVPQDVLDVVSLYADHTVLHQVVFAQNKGHGPARAAAIDACSHSWMAIIDSDDISRPDRFKVLLDAIAQYPDCAVIGAGLQEFHETDQGRVTGSIRHYPETPESVRAYLGNRSPIAQPTAILRVAAIRAVGNYQIWHNNEDYHLWIRLVAAGYTLRNIQQVVVDFRTSPDLYDRRGGLRYWWHEVRLQWFNLRQGTGRLDKFIFGAIVRFVVQVALPNRARSLFYKKVLRRS